MTSMVVNAAGLENKEEINEPMKIEPIDLEPIDLDLPKNDDNSSKIVY
jgi:hypothetical protein